MVRCGQKGDVMHGEGLGSWWGHGYCHSLGSSEAAPRRELGCKSFMCKVDSRKARGSREEMRRGGTLTEGEFTLRLLLRTARAQSYYVLRETLKQLLDSCPSRSEKTEAFAHRPVLLIATYCFYGH